MNNETRNFRTFIGDMAAYVDIVLYDKGREYDNVYVEIMLFSNLSFIYCGRKFGARAKAMSDG
jgi:hypothetical protein